MSEAQEGLRRRLPQKKPSFGKSVSDLGVSTSAHADADSDEWHTGSGGSRRPARPRANSEPETPLGSGGESSDDGEHMKRLHNEFRLTNNEFPERHRQGVVLLVLAVVLSYFAWHNDVADGPREGALRAATAVVIGMCTFTYLQTKDSPAMRRPHPGVWRAFYGLAVLYFLVLVALFVQKQEHAIKFLQVFFPEVGSKETMGMEHLDCAINVQSVWSQLTSIWFVAHFVGWWGKMCMFRSWGYCLALSAWFEIFELTLQFMIPEFQ